MPFVLSINTCSLCDWPPSRKASEHAAKLSLLEIAGGPMKNVEERLVCRRYASTEEGGGGGEWRRGREGGGGGGEVEEMRHHGYIEYRVQDMYRVSAHGVDERMINVHDDGDDDDDDDDDE